MADYVAMYLEIRADLTKPTHFIPIMHFAENTTRLAQDIKNGAFFTNEVVVGEAVERISNQTPFQISVLFTSTLPATKVIMNNAALKQMHLMTEDLKAILNPPSSPPLLMPPEIPTVSIKLGMKNKSTPYPKEFVEDSNFTGGRFVIQLSDVQVREDVAFIDKNLFVALTFHHVTGQIFMHPE